MTRSRLDGQLQEINHQVMALGRLVAQGLESVLDACAQNDVLLCNQIIAADEQVDCLRNAISKNVLRLMILQQPLGPRDLRFLTAVLSIVSHLERAGDGAAGIARLQLQIIPLYRVETHRLPEAQQVDERPRPYSSPWLLVDETTICESLQQLGQKACSLLRKTMQAFTTCDPLFARTIIEEDEFLNIRYRIIRYDLMSLLEGVHGIASVQQDAASLQRITYLFWIAHKLERVGDHCVNICKRTIYIAEGSARARAS